MKKILLTILMLVLTPILLAQSSERVFDREYFREQSRRDLAKLQFIRGYNEYNAGRFAEATAEFHSSLDAVSDTRTIFWLAQSYLQRGQSREAERILRTAPFAALQQRAKIFRQVLTDPQRIQERFFYSRVRSLDGNRWDRSSFSNPSGIAVDAEGTMYVCAIGSGEVKSFASDGSFIRTLARGVQPFKIALDAENNIYYSDFANHEVVKLDPSGAELLRFGGKGNQAGQFLGPEGIVVDAHGAIYVADNGNHRVQKFAPDGRFLMMFGRYGDGDGEFRGPVDLALLHDEIQVLDYGNHRVSRFDLSGNWLADYGSQYLHSPRGLAYYDEAVYIADATGRLVAFSADGEKIGSLVDADGRLLDMEVPYDVVVREGIVYACDYETARCNTYRMGDLRGYENRALLSVANVSTEFFPTVIHRLALWSVRGMPITGLTNRNFRVFENGARMHPLLLSSREELYANYSVLFVLDMQHMDNYTDIIRGVAREFDFTYRVQLWGLRDQSGAGRVWRTTPIQLRDGVASLPSGGERGLAAAIEDGVTLLLPERARRAIVLFVERWENSEATDRAVLRARMNNIPLIVVHFREHGGCPDAYARNIYYGEYQPSVLATMIKETVSGDYFLMYQTADPDAHHQVWKDVEIRVDHLGVRSDFPGGYLVP